MTRCGATRKKERGSNGEKINSLKKDLSDKCASLNV
jgi:hypothetical protein